MKRSRSFNHSGRAILSHTSSKTRLCGFRPQSVPETRLDRSQFTFLQRLTTPNPLESASGVPYYGYRYYNPDLGRWVNRDPIGIEGGLNASVFAFNSSVLYIDDFGLRVREGTPPCRVVPPNFDWPPSTIRQIQRPPKFNLPSTSTGGFHGAVAGAPGMLMDWWTFWRSPIFVFDRGLRQCQEISPRNLRPAPIEPVLICPPKEQCCVIEYHEKGEEPYKRYYFENAYVVEMSCSDYIANDPGQIALFGRFLKMLHPW